MKEEVDCGYVQRWRKWKESIEEGNDAGFGQRGNMKEETFPAFLHGRRAGISIFPLMDLWNR